jgi:hypothetical protein
MAGKAPPTVGSSSAVLEVDIEKYEAVCRDRFFLLQVNMQSFISMVPK